MSDMLQLVGDDAHSRTDKLKHIGHSMFFSLLVMMPTQVQRNESTTTDKLKHIGHEAYRTFEWMFI
jgi:hypothetical protein